MGTVTFSSRMASESLGVWLQKVLAHGFGKFFPELDVFCTEAHVGDEFLTVRRGDFEFKNSAFLDSSSYDRI